MEKDMPTGSDLCGLEDVMVAPVEAGLLLTKDWEELSVTTDVVGTPLVAGFDAVRELWVGGFRDDGVMALTSLDAQDNPAVLDAADELGGGEDVAEGLNELESSTGAWDVPDSWGVLVAFGVPDILIGSSEVLNGLEVLGAWELPGAWEVPEAWDVPEVPLGAPEDPVRSMEEAAEEPGPGLGTNPLSKFSVNTYHGI
jgi:hypothetical protein